jgi:hypothetical protein
MFNSSPKREIKAHSYSQLAPGTNPLHPFLRFASVYDHFIPFFPQSKCVRFFDSTFLLRSFSSPFFFFFLSQIEEFVASSLRPDNPHFTIQITSCHGISNYIVENTPPPGNTSRYHWRGDV